MAQLSWIYEDNGKVLYATMNNPIGVVFKLRPTKQDGTSCEVHVGCTTDWNTPQVYHVASSFTKEPVESDTAKAQAIRAFKSWADAVYITAGTDHGQWMYGLNGDKHE